MNFIESILTCAALAVLPLTAQQAASQPTPRVEPPATPSPKEDANACSTKGCPMEDQHGHPATECSYESGLETAFKCILLCNYTDAQWGSIVGSSACD